MINRPLSLRLKKTKELTEVDLSIFIESICHRYKMDYHTFMKQPIPWILTNASVAVISDKKFRAKMKKPGDKKKK